MRGSRTLREGRTATPCGEEPPLVQPNPNPRTGEVKPPYRAERLPQQGRTLIRSGKGSRSFNGGQYGAFSNTTTSRPTSLIFGIICTVPAGMLEPHSFATRTAAERPAGSAIGCNRVFGELRLRKAYTWLARRYPIISGCRLVV